MFLLTSCQYVFAVLVVTNQVFGICYLNVEEMRLLKPLVQRVAKATARARIVRMSTSQTRKACEMCRNAGRGAPDFNLKTANSVTRRRKRIAVSSITSVIYLP
jgi:hypothetical protein